MSFYNAELLDYFVFMLFTYILLGIIQLFKKNVNKKGNLKIPVAFTPYIVATFLLFL